MLEIAVRFFLFLFVLYYSTNFVFDEVIKDGAKNFLADPIQDSFTDGIVDIAMGNEEESDLFQFLNDDADFGQFDLSGLADEFSEENNGGILGAAAAAAGATFFGSEAEATVDIGGEHLGEAFDEGACEACCLCFEGFDE